MTAPSGRRPLGRLLLATIAFVLVVPPGLDTPLGLAAIPLVMLVLVANPRPRALILVGIASAAVGGVWLASGSGLPYQTMSAAALIGGVVFAAMRAYGRGSLTHRTMLAIALTAVLVAALYLAIGVSWNELKWFVARQTSLYWGLVAYIAGTDQASWVALQPVIRYTASFVQTAFPAVLALQLAAGCMIASSIVERVAPGAVGSAPGRFRNFGFSEHLGWLAVVPAAALLFTSVPSIRDIAANVLLIAASLYALRGFAVAVFAQQTRHYALLPALARMGGVLALFSVPVALVMATEGHSFFATLPAVLIILVLLTLPVALAGAILLGLLDSVLDIRRRWLTPPPAGA